MFGGGTCTGHVNGHNRHSSIPSINQDQRRAVILSLPQRYGDLGSDTSRTRAHFNRQQGSVSACLIGQKRYQIEAGVDKVSMAARTPGGASVKVR